MLIRFQPSWFVKDRVKELSRSSLIIHVYAFSQFWVIIICFRHQRIRERVELVVCLLVNASVYIQPGLIKMNWRKILSLR